MESLLALALLSTQAFASPTPLSGVGINLQKRGDPKIGKDFSAEQIIQIKDGFKDACTLAQAALAAVKKDGDVFVKYFKNDAVNTVHTVFTNIIGGDNKKCSKKLSQITISKDFKDEDGDLSCSDSTVLGSTRDADDENKDPTLILCDRAFDHGGIDKGYQTQFGNNGIYGGPTITFDAPAAVTCKTLDDRASWKMNVLGATLLHEYTHWWEMTEPALSHGTRDTDPKTGDDEEAEGIYGPYNTQQATSLGFTEEIADSYTWFALEAYWTETCKTKYGKATAADGKDPVCDDEECKA